MEIKMTNAQLIAEANRLEANLTRLNPTNRERAIARITQIRLHVFVAAML